MASIVCARGYWRVLRRKDRFRLYRRLILQRTFNHKVLLNESIPAQCNNKNNTLDSFRAFRVGFAFILRVVSITVTKVDRDFWIELKKLLRFQ